MKIRTVVIGACLLAANLPLAQAASCNAAASDPHAPAEVRKRLAAACAQAESSRSCERQAKDKKLQGEAQRAFVQKCFAGPRAGSPKPRR